MLLLIYSIDIYLVIFCHLTHLSHKIKALLSKNKILTLKYAKLIYLLFLTELECVF